MVACAPYWGPTKCATPNPAAVPRMVTPQISHLKRRTALTTRRQSTPPSGSAPPHSALRDFGDGGTIAGGGELDGGSGRWFKVIEGVPLEVARGVAPQSVLSSALRVASPIPVRRRRPSAPMPQFSAMQGR